MREILVAMLASTTLARADGVLHAFPGLDIVESRNQEIYSHGGPPAQFDSMRIEVAVRDARVHTLSVRKLAIASVCEPKLETTPLKLRFHELHDWHRNAVVAKGMARVRTPAGADKRYSLRVRFKEITRTEGCAYVVDLVVDRVAKQVRIPLTIIREADLPD